MSTSSDHASLRGTRRGHQGPPLRLRPYQRAPARPVRTGRSLVEPALPPRLRRRHRDRRAAWRRRHRDAGRELRHGGAARARRHAARSQRSICASTTRSRPRPGLDIKAHSVCYRTTRSIAFVRSTAYQESEDDPVATATACFMIGANRTNMLADRRMESAQHPDAGGAGGSGRPVRQQPVRALPRHSRE